MSNDSQKFSHVFPKISHVFQKISHVFWESPNVLFDYFEEKFILKAENFCSADKLITPLSVFLMLSTKVSSFEKRSFYY